MLVSVVQWLSVITDTNCKLHIVFCSLLHYTVYIYWFVQRKQLFVATNYYQCVQAFFEHIQVFNVTSYMW